MNGKAGDKYSLTLFNSFSYNIILHLLCDAAFFKL